jgi:flagellar biosynthesis/type III secretory pathway M-ring protein FliF/YscJ
MWIALFVIVVVLILLIKFRKKIFRKREEPALPAQTEVTPEDVTTGNVKAKMDLVLTQVDSLRTQYEALNQRTQTIESMVREIYNLAKS